MKKRVLLGMMSVIFTLTMPAQAMAYEEDEAVVIEYQEASEGEAYDVEVNNEESYETELIEEADLEISDVIETAEELGDETAEEDSYIYGGTTVTATKVNITGLTISGQALAVAGKNYQYTVSVSPAKASNSVNWEVQPSDSGVKIDAKGKLTIDADCELENCTVIATSNTNSDVKASFDVSINPGIIKTMNIYDGDELVNGGTITIFRAGDRTKFRDSVLPEVRLTSSTGKEFVHTPYKITNNKENVVRVDKEGRIWAVGDTTDTATITYTAIDGSAKSVKIKVRVANPVTEITLRLPENRSKYVAKGKTIKLTPSIEAKYGTPWNSGVTFTSSNPTVATVNKNGVVTMKADSYSSVTITATAKDGSGTSCSVDLIACNVVKNISIGRFSLNSKNAQVQKLSLSEGKLVLPVIYNDPDGGNAEKKYTCPYVEVTSNQPKYLEVSFEDGYITLNPLQQYNKKNIAVKVTVLDGSNTTKTWNFRVFD